MITLRHKTELETITFVAVAALIGSFFVFRNNQNFFKKYAITPFLDNSIPKIISPIINPITKMESSSQLSPDGKKTIVMEKKHDPDGKFNYTFYVKEANAGFETKLYSTDVDTTVKFALPFNTWSPDNKYLFILKNQTDALVFKASGEPIAPNQLFLEVDKSFKEKGHTDKIMAITGWASETLIIVNTAKDDGTFKSSWWFEVPSKTILQLYGQF